MSWTELLVGDLVDAGEAEVKTGPFGTQLRASDYVETGTPVINVRNIGFGDIRPEKLEYIAQETVQRLSSHLLRAGDIVFGRKGAVERHAFIREGTSGWFQGSDCLRLRIVDERRALPRFLSYAFLDEQHKKWMIQQCSHGATMASLNQDIIRRIPLRLPPLPKQHHIAAILSAYDDLIDNNTRRIAILEEMARRLYDEWFVFDRPDVDEVKDGWKWLTLGELCSSSGGSIQTGPFGSQLHQRDYRPEGTAVVMPKNLRGGRIDFDSCARVASEDAERLAKHRLKSFDIVFGRRGEIGRKALVRPHEEGAICGTGCLKVSLGTPVISPFYVSEFLSESRTVADLAGRAIGATMPNLNTAILAETKIPVPFGKALRQYHDLASASDQMTTLLHRKNTNLRAQRDMLLPKLISGEIDVSETEEAMEAAE